MRKTLILGRQLQNGHIILLEEDGEKYYQLLNDVKISNETPSMVKNLWRPITGVNDWIYVYTDLAPDTKIHVAGFELEYSYIRLPELSTKVEVDLPLSALRRGDVLRMHDRFEIVTEILLLCSYPLQYRINDINLGTDKIITTYRLDWEDLVYWNNQPVTYREAFKRIYKDA